MPPDFSRDVRCILGLPFDVVTEAQAEEAIRLAIDRRKRLFVSTPNLNFAVSCLSDKDFRASVLQSDLSLADGWPIVAIARLIGAALPGRVAGSSLFHRLVASQRRPPISVYFFGGPDDVAQAACQRLNSLSSGAVCTGFHSPGFGSVAELSSTQCLERLNAARPDLVVVALGAKKGQAWIRHNLAYIDAPVISHLGAVINFIAGTVARAPEWLQVARLEWLWRIKEEPALWKRYTRDGLSLLRLLLTRVIALTFHQRLLSPGIQDLERSTANLSKTSKGTTLTLTGAWTRENVSTLRSLLTSLAASGRAVSVDMAAVTHLDSTSIGLFTLLYGWQLKTDGGWDVVAPSRAVRTALRLSCTDYLLVQHRTSPTAK